MDEVLFSRATLARTAVAVSAHRLNLGYRLADGPRQLPGGL